MITLEIVDDRTSGATDPFFTWLYALDVQRFNIVVGGVSSTIEQAVTRHANQPRPDVWLMRARTIGTDALHRLCGDASQAGRPRPVVAVCDDPAEIGNILAERVSAAVLPNDSPWHITSAIHSAAARKLFLTSQVLDQYRDQIVDLIAAPRSRRLDVLTAREHDVLIALAEGRTNSDIARRLFISRATVGSHVLSILRKLDVSNRTEAAALAHQFGLMDKPTSSEPVGRAATRRTVHVSPAKELRHA